MRVQGRKDRQNHGAWSQDLVFFPGPSADNALAGHDDYVRREQELQTLITPGNGRSTRWFGAIEEAYGLPISLIGIDVRSGSMRGVYMPTIAIDMMGTYFGKPGDSNTRVNDTGKRQAVALCRALMDALGVAWCDAWYVGAFNSLYFKCDADGVHDSGRAPDASPRVEKTDGEARSRACEGGHVRIRKPRPGETVFGGGAAAVILLGPPSTT